MMDWDSDPELKQIRKEFIDSFEERRSMLSKIAREVGALKGDFRKLSTKNYDELYFIVHKLAGTAESYDFPSLTKVAASVERYIGGDRSSVDTSILSDCCLLLSEGLDEAKNGTDPARIVGDQRFIRMTSSLND